MNSEIANGFSNPFEPFDDDFAVSWVRAVYANRLQVFLDRWSSVLENHAEGLSRVLRNFADLIPLNTDGLAIREIFWHPFCNLAPIDEVDTDSRSAALARAMQFALRLSEFDPGIAAAVSLPKPVSLGFSVYKLPAAAKVRLSGHDLVRRIDVYVSNCWQTFVFEQQASNWFLPMGDAYKQPYVCFAGKRIMLYPLARSIDAPDAKVIAPNSSMVNVLQDSLDLIDRISPAYRRWIARMLRVVVPLRPVMGQYDSETFASLNGTAFISLHPDVIRTAETLVHEVSHDYLHVLNTMDPLADGSGVEVFFSPVRQCDRPTLAILKAQHAFVNVLLFYYLLEMSGVRLDGHYVRGVAKLEAWRRQLEGSLSRAASVTEFGDRIWRSLAHRADQLQMLARSAEVADAAF